MQPTDSRAGGACCPQEPYDAADGGLPGGGSDFRGELLMLAYFFPPQNTSGAARPFRFFKYLPRFGYTPQVICADSEAATPVPESVHPVKETRRWSLAGMVSAAAKVPQRLLRRYGYRLPWVPLAIAQASRLIANGKIRAVFSTSPPLACHLAAAYLKFRYGLRWIADFRDPLYPDPPLFGESVPFYEPMAEAFFFRYADAILVNTAAAAEMWSRRYPRYKDKITVMYNGFDPDDQVGAEPIPERPYKVLTHAGEIYGPRDPGSLLSALDRLIEKGAIPPDQIRVRLIGPVESDAALCANPSFHKLMTQGIVESDGVRVAQGEARKAIAASDYLLLIDTSGAVQLPAKIFDYVRIGRPVLALTGRNSTSEQLLGASGIRHVCVYTDDPKEQIDNKLALFLSLSSEPVEPSPWFWEQFNAISQTRALAGIAGRLNPGAISILAAAAKE